MDEEHQIVIPTLSRAKISRNLSYPIGAEAVSIALASAPQFPQISLHFYGAFVTWTRKGRYQFLRVQYSNSLGPPRDLYKRPQQGRWEIVVQPVPRPDRSRVKQYIIETALPQIIDWLENRAELTQLGDDIFTFSYNDKTKEFTTWQSTNLEPSRVRGR